MKRILAAFLLLPAIASAQSVTIRLNPPQNAKYTFQGNSDMSSAAGDMKQSYKQILTVASKTAKGCTIKYSVKDAKVTATGPGAEAAKQTEASMNNLGFSATYDQRGRLIGAAKATGDASTKSIVTSMAGYGFMGMEYPAGPIKKGTSWSITVDMAKMLGSMIPGVKVSKGGKLPLKYTVTGIAKKGGKTVVTVGFVMKGNLTLAMDMQGQQMSMTMVINAKGASNVDATDGVLINSTTTSKYNTKIGGMSIDQDMTATYKRI